MSNIQGGVYGATSKKALKDAVTTDPSTVTFFATSMFGSEWQGRVSELPAEHTLTIVGPDPYKKRTWYATIQRVGNKLTVK